MSNIFDVLLKIQTTIVVCIAVGSGYVYQHNPLLFGQKTVYEESSHNITNYTIYDHYPNLDDELFPLASSLGKNLTAYRNHCLRVLTFAKFFLPESTEQDLPNAMDLAATAIAYHRVGLWTDKNLNYLESSKDQLDKALESSFTPKEMKIMREIILQQHKVTDYTEMSSETENALVNAVRKASWADATMGLIRFDLPASLLEAAYDQLQEAGFHKLIWEMNTNLSPGIGIMSGIMEAGKIVKW